MINGQNRTVLVIENINVRETTLKRVWHRKSFHRLAKRGRQVLGTIILGPQESANRVWERQADGEGAVKTWD